MKELVPNLLKALGVILVSAFILFLFYPKDRIKDQVLNTALELLGNKLLAMVPKENEQNVQREFEAVRAQALEGRVDEKHFEEFVTVVLNAEAEGKPLPPEKIDSSLAALRRWEFRMAKDEKRLQEWAERMQAFEEFQTHWEQTLEDSGWAPPPGRFSRRPLYRVAPNFVVKIDTAALAAMAAARVHVHVAESPAMIEQGHAPPLPPHVARKIKELSKTSKGLPIELEYRFATPPDSFHFEHHMPPPPAAPFAVPPEAPRAEPSTSSSEKKKTPPE